MRFPAIYFFYFVFPAFLWAADADPRVWTDLHGRQIEATLLEVTGEEITIERSDGQRFTVPSSTFSEEDRAYVREWLNRIQTGGPALEPPKWPVRVQTKVPRAEVVEERGEANIYRTEHFEFRSDARLSRTLVAQFGQIFEATLAAVQALPIGLDIAAREEGHFVTRLFSSPSDYYRAGGIWGSGGLYTPAAREILVPIENLGVKSSSSGYSFDRYRDNSALIHEITHQVMHPWLQVLPVWLAEGMAVYMETIPYQRGAFQFRQQDLEAYLEKRTGQRESLPIAPLEQLMNLSYGDWTGEFADNQNMVAANYYTALLLTYYYLHLDGDGDASRLIQYIQARRAGTSDEEAIQTLLAGRTIKEIEEAMISAFSRTGIHLQSPH